VDDCVDALLKAGGEPAAIGEIINIGSDQASTFREVAETLAEIIPGTEWRYTDFTPERRAQEPGDFVSDISKARRVLSWEPSVSLRAGLERTVAFYRERRGEYF
jgi:UDP-glucose 4-epimerase